MARRYEQLSDEDLASRVTKFTDALEEIALGGEVAKIQSDGRLMEIAAGHTDHAERILNMLLDEQECRKNGGRLPSRALGMRFYP